MLDLFQSPICSIQVAASIYSGALTPTSMGRCSQPCRYLRPLAGRSRFAFATLQFPLSSYRVIETEKGVIRCVRYMQLFYSSLILPLKL